MGGTAKALALVAIGIVLAETAAGAPIVIGFEEPVPQGPGTSGRRPEYREAGFVFSEAPLPGGPPNGMGRTGALSGGRPGNGTSFLSFLLNSSLVFRMDDGSSFDLLAVDLAEYSVVFQAPKDVSVVGERLDGTIVEVLFVTDGQIDGAFGPLPDFETFLLPSTFIDLVEVRIPVDTFAIDNVAVRLVPEPPFSVHFGAVVLSCLGMGFMVRSPTRRC